MLTGGVVAYPTLNDYLVSPDSQSLQFSVTFTPFPTQVAAQPTRHVEPTQTACPGGQCQENLNQAQNDAVAPTPPAPVILPVTELEQVHGTPTATVIPVEEGITPQAEPTATPRPTDTPTPTRTPDPASLIPGRLVIPAIDLDAPILEVGWETKEVNGGQVSNWIVPDAFAAGWHVTSALPGDPGNTILNGHHNIHGEIFRDLEDLEPGDEIIVYTGEQAHYYAVTERHILKEKYESAEVRQENARFILPSEDERLTMVTCWPYTNNTHRLIVVALPIQPTATPTPRVE